MATSLKEKLAHELNLALKSGESLTVSTLRLLLAAIHNREIEKRGSGKEEMLSDEEVLQLVRREARKRKEAIELYRKGGREDLAEKEERELAILQAYLPQELGEEEIRKIIEDAVARVGVQSIKDFGKVMGEVMQNVKGKADAQKVSGLVKERLAK